jgi:uncharacterized protein YyaL (SSP411 family)
MARGRPAPQSSMMRRVVTCRATHSAIAAALLLLCWANPGMGAVEDDVAPVNPVPIAQPRRPNRLINEKSPYLREHAYNPVDWCPWGEEAFSRARRENKPIFLSIGYSTCHWCHVMARESFENEAIAHLMNESFVCIKVDREERPDVDQVYLAYVESATGSSGWPMTVLLTPDLKPFFGGSYFPPEDSKGHPGLRSIIGTYSRAWKTGSGSIVADSNQILAEIREQAAAAPGSDRIGDGVSDDGYRQLAANFDPKFGGFGGAPKFPRPSVLAFLFQTYSLSPRTERGRHSLDMALFTLRRISEGGIHDHIGGGFHRYAVDESWQVPHFEKMLYDQAQLAECYLDAYQVTHDKAFAESARDILDFAGREMTSPEGGFYSAQDADSLAEPGSRDRSEGAYYVWAERDIEGLIGPERARIFNFHFGVEAGGNVRGKQHGEFEGRNILAQAHSPAETARMAGVGEADVDRVLDESRALLLRARNGRPHPNIDHKVIASWNGLMISAYSRGYQVLNDPAYLENATRAAAFIEKAMYRGKGGPLLRSYCDGPSAVEGFADDYAFVIQGLLDLYEASFDVHWLEWAERLQEQQNRLFWDTGHDGYFETTGQDATVLVRSKPYFDGAEPSANSVSAMNLLRLGAIFDDAAYRATGEKTIAAFASQIHRSPSSLSGMLVSIDWLRNPPRQIMIEGRADGPDTLVLLAELNRHFVPRKTVVLADGDAGQQFFARRIPLFADLPRLPPATAVAFVCENYVCRLPTSDVEKFSGLLSP